MLRVSSLGLIYHDASRSAFSHPRRFIQKVATHQITRQKVHHGRKHRDQFDEDGVGRSQAVGHVTTAKTTSLHLGVGHAASQKDSSESSQKTHVSRAVTKRNPSLQSGEKSRKKSGEKSGKTSSSKRRTAKSPPTTPGLYQDLEESKQLTDDLPRLDQGSPLPSDAHSAIRSRLEKVMAVTKSVDEAWDAYQALLSLPYRPEVPPIPYARLHRTARLLSSTRPKTRLIFLRLLSILTCLHRTGGAIYQWEWDALIDCAGKGWRVTRIEDFQTALDVYGDMVALRAPGATFFRNDSMLLTEPSSIPLREPVRPGIVTYTTLVNIAGRTLDPVTVQRAMSILQASGFPPNRITYLALIRFYTRTDDLFGVREMIQRMQTNGFELGIDGTNACIWAFGRKGRLDVASSIYRILRHRIVPEDEAGKHELDLAYKRLSADGIPITDDLIPDRTTYYTLIQVYSYHGDLVKCLQIFMDMLRTPSRVGIRGSKPTTSNTADPDLSSPTLPAFRAIFLGFARHGQRIDPASHSSSLTSRLTRTAWTLDNLESLFQSFVTLPHDTNPSARTIYWLLRAYAITSGNDVNRLRSAWDRVAKRFGSEWGGRLERLRQELFTPGQDDTTDQNG